jgi:hypothetical protein
MERARVRADNHKVMRGILLGGVLGLVVAGTAVAVTAHGAERKAARSLAGDPGVFVKRLVVQMAKDDYAQAWQTLHPAHKRVASKWEYVDCELGTPIPGSLVSVKVLRVLDKPVLVPGIWRVVDGKAVTFALTIKAPALKESTRVTHTGHAVSVNGQWRWILPPNRFEVYRSNLCLGEGPKA